MGVMMWMMGRRRPAAEDGGGAVDVADLKAERHPREAAP
jgi:hypothetical protein